MPFDPPIPWFSLRSDSSVTTPVLAAPGIYAERVNFSTLLPSPKGPKTIMISTRKSAFQEKNEINLLAIYQSLYKKLGPWRQEKVLSPCRKPRVRARYHKGGQVRKEIGDKGNSLRILREHLDEKEKETLSSWACLSRDAVRKKPEEKVLKGHRQSFSLDTDRILHSLSYSRYIDKTQVFYLIKNDHITHRVLHVQLVSKIARPIGRLLGLNEDLIEAISLGHDIGHAPFGHDGEKFLSDLSLQYGLGHLLHNLQSVRALERIEKKGRGWNLTLQVLDGILCHDGELHSQALHPDREKDFQKINKEIKDKEDDPSINLYPMTMEGCVVRMADTISYIGRDIEDAIRLGLIKRDDIPEYCRRILGETNGTIVS